MTISSTVSRVSYAGNDVTVAFAFPYKFDANADLVVILKDANDVETVQTITTHYTVSGAGADAGGTVTMVTAPATGEDLTIYRDPPLTQAVNLVENDPQPAETTEGVYDKLTTISQRLDDRMDRAVAKSEGFVDTFDPLLPSDLATADSYLKTNAAGDAWEMVAAVSTALTFPAGTGVVVKNSATNTIVRTLTGTANEVVIADGDGQSGNPTFGIADNPVLPGTEGVQIPNGTTAERPATPVNGDIRYNSTLGLVEIYEGASWVFLAQKNFGPTENVGLNLTSGILKLVQADGSTDFAALTPGYVSVPHSTGGRLARLIITASDHLFEDDTGTSDIVGEEFGVTTGVAWGNSRPFYLYAINGDDTDSGLEFAISPNPCARKSPATTNIGYHGNPAATPSDNNFFFLTSTDVTATHNAKPCVLIGGFTMTMSASDDWTIDALDEGLGDGIRPDPHVGRTLTLALGQMGAESNNVFVTTNAPTWATPANIIREYKLGLDGMCDYSIITENAGNCTNGGDGVACQFSLPYKGQHTNAEERPSVGYVSASGNTPAQGVMMLRIAAGSSNATILSYTSQTVTNNEFTSVNDDVYGRVRFKAFEVA